MFVEYDGLELGATENRRAAVRISDIDFSYPEVRTSDSPHEARDGVMPGRDYVGTRTMTIDCWTNGKTMQEARAQAREVIRSWSARRTRLAAGVLMPLEFQPVDDPEIRRVYGRPRRAEDPNFGVLMRAGRAEFSLQFDVMNPLTYGGGPEAEQSATIRVIEGGAGTGFIFPLTMPFSTESTPERREGSFDVDSELPAPAIIEFHGPGSRMEVRGTQGGWRIGLNPSVTLAHDEVITVDPIKGTVTDNFGRDRYGALDDRSQITGVVIPPGRENVFFSAVDPTNTAQVVISWRPAYSTIL